LLQVTTVVVIATESKVTIRNVLLHIGILRTIEEWELASNGRAACIGSARIIVCAGNVGVNASRRSSGIATSIGCADTEVIAVSGYIEWKIRASRLRIAKIMSASVSIIASDWCIFAFVGASVASIGTA